MAKENNRAATMVLATPLVTLFYLTAGGAQARNILTHGRLKRNRKADMRDK